MKLYSYFRSSAAYRVRIAFNLKGLSYDTAAIHLQKEGGLNRKPDYRAINPQMRVPALRLDSGELLTQSLAIIEYLDEVHPQPPLLPRDPRRRARKCARWRSSSPATSTRSTMWRRCATSRTSSARTRPRSTPGITIGCARASTRSRRCCGPVPTPIGDRGHARRHLPGAAGRQCAAPEGAARPFPKIVAVDAACAKLPAFEQARPENQPDAE